MGKPKTRSKKAPRKKNAKPAAPAKPAKPEATHLAIPLELMKTIRGVLGTMPHDQVNGLLVQLSADALPLAL